MWSLLAEVVVNTDLDGTNRMLDWPVATVLIVLTSVVGWVAWASLRATHSFKHDEDISVGKPVSKKD